MLKKYATVIKEFYIIQLHRVKNTIRLKRLHRQDSCCTSHQNRIQKVQMGGLLVSLVSYSPDLTPTDYHLFRSLWNHMRRITFDNENYLKNWLNNIFDTRPNFWRNGVDKLVKSWKKTKRSNDEDIIDYFNVLTIDKNLTNLFPTE